MGSIGNITQVNSLKTRLKQGSLAPGAPPQSVSPKKAPPILVTPQELLMQNLNYNPLISGLWGGHTEERQDEEWKGTRKSTGLTRLNPCSEACVHCPKGKTTRKGIMGHCKIAHISEDRMSRAKARLERGIEFAQAGITHFGHLLINRQRGGDLRIGSWDIISQKWDRRKAAHIRPLYQALIAGLPNAWFDQVSKYATTMIEENIALSELVTRAGHIPGTWIQDGRGAGVQSPK